MNNMAKNSITREETKKRISYVLLGLFTYMFVEPIREFISEYLNVNGYSGMIVGVVGFLVVLYFFDLK